MGNKYIIPQLRKVFKNIEIKGEDGWIVLCRKDDALYHFEMTNKSTINNVKISDKESDIDITIFCDDIEIEIGYSVDFISLLKNGKTAGVLNLCK